MHLLYEMASYSARNRLFPNTLHYCCEKLSPTVLCTPHTQTVPHQFTLNPIFVLTFVFFDDAIPPSLVPTKKNAMACDWLVDRDGGPIFNRASL